MRIAVYGAGGVGGYFGGRLAQAGADVHFIARGAQLQALREHGLRVRSVKGDFEVQAPATDDPADVGPCDFVLFCVKTWPCTVSSCAGPPSTVWPCPPQRRCTPSCSPGPSATSTPPPNLSHLRSATTARCGPTASFFCIRQSGPHLALAMTFRNQSRLPPLRAGSTVRTSADQSCLWRPAGRWPKM
jgi:ketopantoate reductase PanE/ApbA-like protein